MIWRSPGYYAATHWFPGAVVMVVLGSMASGLLWSLNEVSERAERQAVELTIRNMRTGLQYAMGEALMRQQEGGMVAWIGSNPVRWLDSPPGGYRGECSADESWSLSGGQWCFVRDSHQLAYRPRRVGQLGPGADGLRCGLLKWRVVRGAESVAKGGFVGLRIESVPPCHWVAE